LNQFSNGDGNYAALLAMANSSDVFEVLLTENISISGKDYNMGNVTIDPSFEGSYYSLSTHEIGWTGETINKNESSNGNIQVVINSSLSETGRAEAFAHEGYGHGYFIVIGKNPDHIRIPTGIPGVSDEGNTALKIQIIHRLIETRKNLGLK
jgi:hypothetical protein